MSVREQSCPSWCTKKHIGGEATYHEGETRRVELLSDIADGQFLEIRNVQYLPIETNDSTATASMVELALHSGNRYKVFNLAGDSAQALAQVLLDAALAINGQHAPSES